jgi:hypothetical protein
MKKINLGNCSGVVVSAKPDTDFLHGYTDFGQLNPCIRVQIRVGLSSYKLRKNL